MNDIMKNIFLFSLLVLTLTACSAKPKVVEVERFGDDKLSCPQLEEQLEEAVFYKKQARKDDNFQARYIWVPTGAISAYNFNDAERAAEQRIARVQELGARKHCDLKVQE
jgi:hypothetical protein